MKRKTSIILLSIITAFSAMAAISSSLSWFTSTANMQDMENPIEGSVEDEYYASGLGTAQDPYVITKPRHLYNLAWLQYLGFYNKNSGADDHQFYFVLGDNIDMSNFGPIPPIGTELNPFVGNFDGQGYVVSNLTVSNTFSDYVSHPSSISAWDNNTTHAQPHILGFFGVIGEYPGGNKNSTYSTSVNELKNTGLTGATIKTELLDSLVGIAAGYARDSDTTDSHTVLKNVIVDDSAISLPSTGTTTSYGNDVGGNALIDISESTLVGYTNNKSSVTKTGKSIYGVNINNNYTFNATESGVDNGWGGSVDMKSVLERLITIKGSKSTSAFAVRKTYTHHEITGTVDTNTVNTSDSTHTTLVNDDDEIGHYLFLHRGDTYDSYYAMFGGGHYRTDIYYDEASHTAFQITNGSQYLTINDGAIDKTATQANGNYWAVVDNKLVTKIGDTYYYLRNNNGTLQATNTANNGSAWTIDDSGSNRIIANNGYFINYANNNFQLSAGTPTGTGAPYSIRYQNTSNYLINNGTSGFTNTTDVDIAKIWTLTYGSNTTIRTTINGTNYYIHVGGSWYSGYNMELSTTSTTYTWNTSGNYVKLSNRPAFSTYYIKYNNGSWSFDTGDNNDNLTIEPTTYYSYVSNITKTAYSGSIKGPDEELNNSKRTEGMNYSEDDVTYFPLSTVNNTDNFKPDKSNTAYVVSGSMGITSSTSALTAGNNSVIRFSNLFGLEQWTLQQTTYPASLGTDFNLSTGEFNAVYTVTKNGNTYGTADITNDYTNYVKLKAAKESLGNVMKTANNPQKKAYGVHFMNAAISMNALTTAPYVKVNGQEYTDYQLPVNCIDFHLKEFGYINFMAGTYYRNSDSDRNNSFFSLYQIERLESSPKLVNRILEIRNVYQHTSKDPTYSYVYELYDGTNTFYTKPYVVTDSEGGRRWLYDEQSSYSKNQYVNSLPLNYTLKFNVDVIKTNNLSSATFDYHPFYFEIPMNDGEFCLGSVSGGTGAYLMYLDIAANAAKTNRTVAFEKFTINQKTYVHPVGVALQPLPTTYTTGVTTININTVVDDNDSACMEIKPTANGDYTMDRTANTVAITRANTTLAPPTYASDDITLTGTGDLEPVPTSSVYHNVQRMQFYDYLINTNTLSVTTITDFYSSNGTFENRVIEQKRYTGNAISDNPTSTLVYDPTGILGQVKDDSADMKIYNTTSGMSYYVSEFTDHTKLTIDNARLPSSQILEIKIIQNGDGYLDSTTLKLILDTAASQTDTYYKFNNYTIVLTANSGDIIVKVLDYESTFSVSTYNDSTKQTTSSSFNTVIIINGETVTAEGQIIPQNP